jgi:hypothetical protein
MTHLREPVAKADGSGGYEHDERCPFCQEPEKGDLETRIRKRTNSTELGKSLENNAECSMPRKTFTHPHDSTYKFTSEPHHLLPGKEALAEVPEVEQWLSARIDGSYVSSDTGFDINSYKNGIWLPSVPVEYKNGGWGNLEHNRKQTLAFAIMEQESLQFHKGPHSDKGRDPTQDYVKDVKMRLGEVLDYISKWLIACPVAKEKESNREKYPPPTGLNEIIYTYVSRAMAWAVAGPPADWRVYVSTLACECTAEKEIEKKRRQLATQAANPQ